MVGNDHFADGVEIHNWLLPIVKSKGVLCIALPMPLVKYIAKDAEMVISALTVGEIEKFDNVEFDDEVDLIVAGDADIVIIGDQSNLTEEIIRSAQNKVAPTTLIVLGRIAPHSVMAVFNIIDSSDHENQPTAISFTI